MKITCRINVFFFVCVVTLASLLSACGGGGEDTPSTTTTTPPATAIKTTIDEKSRVTAVIPPTGGTITTTGQDGTKYTLTFPAGSTAIEIQVSLAPILSVTGTVFDSGFVAAVDMTPNGQQFSIPATLTIELPSPIAGNGLPIGVHIINNNKDYNILPAQANGNVYTIEINHFSGILLSEASSETITQYVYDKFYGSLGIANTLLSLTSCDDYRLDILVQKILDINAAIDAVDGAHTEDGSLYLDDSVFDPPVQCTGYLGDIPETCGSFFELGEAARRNLDEAYRKFTELATQQCAADDPAQEATAFACIKHALKWEGVTRDPDLNDTLCNIKANCGIASLEVQPDLLTLAVSESQQLTATPRDLAGNELVDRELGWLPVSNTSIARLSNLSVNNPYATGLRPGYTSTMVVDLMGQAACPGMSYVSASINVTNEFVTSAQSIIVPEGETTALQVKLAYPPEVGVSASVSRISGDTDLTVASGETLVFKSDNWDIYQTVLFFAHEDDQDIENGTAVFEIKDTYLAGTDNAPVSPKEILAQESDNDGPSMFITPDPLCVEAGQKANLSVIGNEYVDLGAITWSSSDIGVATVNTTGVVDAASPGPARITADMIVDNQIIASAFATITVKNHCATIHSANAPAHSCITTASSPGFESAASSIQLEAMINTPQDGYALTWDTTNNGVLTITPNTDLTGTVRGVSGGSANAELTVNNIVTQYHATLPITVASLPEDYKAIWLSLPYDPAKPHVLNSKREVLSYSQLYATLQDAVAKCNINLDLLPEGVSITNMNESGQYIGQDQESYNIVSGFVFDSRSCFLQYFTPPMQTPPGSFENFTTTYPLAINDQGTIVGFVNWHAYDDYWCNNPDYTCTYSVDTAFVLENGAFTFPFLNTSIPPYQNDYDNIHSRISDINNNRYTLFDSHSSYNGGEGLYQLDSPIGPTNPVLFDLGGSRALNDYQHVIGTDVTSWIFTNGSYFDLNPVFSSGDAPSIIFADQINNSDDILARGANAGETYKYFLMYLCPLPIESPTAQWIEDRSVLEGYEELEVSCDGRDNDLNGIVDFPLVAQFTTKQAGVCAGMVKECKGTQGWVDDYSSNPYYEFPEVSCDGRDNDCDGAPDEGCPPSVAAIQ